MSKKELNIFKLLSEKPWEESQALIDRREGATAHIEKTRTQITK